MRNSTHFIEHECWFRGSEKPATSPNMNHINPVNAIRKINPHPSTHRSYKCGFSFRFPNHNPVFTSPLAHMCYMPLPSHSSSFERPNNIWWRRQTMEPLLIQFIPFFCDFSSFGPSIFLNALFASTMPAFFRWRKRPRFTAILNRQNATSAYFSYYMQ